MTIPPRKLRRRAFGLLLVVACAPKDDPPAAPANARADAGARPQADPVPKPSEPAIPATDTALGTPVRAAVSADPPGAPDLGEIGTDSSTVVVDTAPDGHWVAFCQARRDTDGKPGISVSLGRHGDLHGDAMVPYLTVAGRELELQSFVGSDASGRFVAVTRPGEGLVLLDTWAADEFALTGANRVDDDSPFGTHPAVAFSDGRVAYARALGGGTQLVVRDLLGGRETVLDPGEGELGRFEFDGSGRRLVLRMAVRDTNADGKVTLPVARTSLAGRRCRGPVGSFSRMGFDGDDPAVKVVDIRPGAIAREVPGALVSLAGGSLVRSSDGAISLHGDAGVTELFDPKCNASIVHVQPDSDEVWAACRSKGVATAFRGSTMAPLVHWANGVQTELGLAVEFFDHDQLVQPLGLIFAFDGTTMHTVNARTKTQGLSITAEGMPSVAVGDRLLYLSHTKSFVYDLATARRHRIRGLDPGYASVRRDTMVAVRTGRRTTVLDMATETVLGKTKPGAMAVARSGHVLVARRGNEAVMKPPVGPLRWYEPK